MKKFAAVCVSVLLLLTTMVGCGGSTTYTDDEGNTHEKVTLNVYNWADYIDEESVLQDFEKEYPWITINYQPIPNNEEMLVQLQSQDSDCDIAFPSDYVIEQLKANNRLQTIDKDNIPNFQYISDFCKNKDFDPNNDYSVPYFWGTVGIVYNKTMVQEPVDSWNVLWDEQYSGQIFMYDSIRDTIGLTLKKLGYSMNTRDESQLEEAQNALIEQKPLVKAYLGDEIKGNMINNNGALAVMYSGDAIFCMENNEDLAYVVPKEGSNVWFDNMVIMDTCEHKEEAELFINYMCDPEVSEKNAIAVGYSTPNSKALELLGEDYINDTTYNPPQEVLEKCEIFHDLGDFLSVYNDVWTKVKAAK